MCLISSWKQNDALLNISALAPPFYFPLPSNCAQHSYLHI